MTGGPCGGVFGAREHYTGLCRLPTRVVLQRVTCVAGRCPKSSPAQRWYLVREQISYVRNHLPSCPAYSRGVSMKAEDARTRAGRREWAGVAVLSLPALLIA